MAVSAVNTALGEAPPPRRQRWLEDERWLALVLLLPTTVLLGLFIAYPFARGIVLSVTDSRVGVPGDFVGFANYQRIWSDGIFRTAVYNTFVYTGVTTVFPGDLPSDPASLKVGESEGAPAREAVHFLRFRPPRVSLLAPTGDAAALPHIRLDRAIDFLLGDRLA